MHAAIVVGTDTYGRVKAVGGTAIVTKFLMGHMLPIYPQQSFYVWAQGNPTPTTVEELKALKVIGIPLSRVNTMSVLFAYARRYF